MTRIIALVFAMLFPTGLLASDGGEMLAGTPTPDLAEEVASAEDGVTNPGMEAPEGLLFMDAREVNVRDFIWVHRIIVVMADTPEDPQFTRQLDAIRAREADFLERDAVVIFDAHPEDASPLRQVMRPRGFMTAIIDKDGEVKARRPAVRTGRELMAVIDRFPTRRQEMLERLPSGR